MHPNAFLMTLWRTEIIDQVFVAMSFEPRFIARFESIVRPAIEDQPFKGKYLKAYRIDNSRTGDSILTDIVTGIAHSRLILADVSVIDEGRFVENPIRNGNVMYEVGVALACRTSSEVLLIRDDSKPLLFDVSTVPHVKMDFSNKEKSIKLLRSVIADRIQESDLIKDSRIALAIRNLTQYELYILIKLSTLKAGEAMDLSHDRNQLTFPDDLGVTRLLAKGCIESVAVNPDKGTLYYSLTQFGKALLEVAKNELIQVAKDRKPKHRKKSVNNPLTNK